MSVDNTEKVAGLEFPSPDLEYIESFIGFLRDRSLIIKLVLRDRSLIIKLISVELTMVRASFTRQKAIEPNHVLLFFVTIHQPIQFKNDQIVYEVVQPPRVCV